MVNTTTLVPTLDSNDAQIDISNLPNLRTFLFLTAKFYIKPLAGFRRWHNFNRIIHGNWIVLTRNKKNGSARCYRRRVIDDWRPCWRNTITWLALMDLDPCDRIILSAYSSRTMWIYTQLIKLTLPFFFLFFWHQNHNKPQIWIYPSLKLFDTIAHDISNNFV